jgi:hypothetical protein
LSFEGRGAVHVRELCPKDFYFAQILRNKEQGMLPLISRLILNPEVLDLFTLPQTEKIFKWVGEEIINEKVLTVENWLEVSFHLCKQRWDNTVDWLENQPMSKILTMISIVEDFAEKQEQEVKKSSRGR